MKKTILIVIAFVISSCDKKEIDTKIANDSGSALSQEQWSEIETMNDAEFIADSVASVVDYMSNVAEDGEDPRVKKAIELQKVIARDLIDVDSVQAAERVNEYEVLTSGLTTNEKDFIKYQAPQSVRKFLRIHLGENK